LGTAVSEISEEPTWRRDLATQSGSINGLFRRAPERFDGVDCSPLRCFDCDIGILPFGIDCAAAGDNSQVYLDCFPINRQAAVWQSAHVAVDTVLTIW
jgi:hypothetical protein